MFIQVTSYNGIEYQVNLDNVTNFAKTSGGCFVQYNFPDNSFEITEDEYKRIIQRLVELQIAEAQHKDNLLKVLTFLETIEVRMKEIRDNLAGFAPKQVGTWA